jgi:hypothetical protein
MDISVALRLLWLRSRARVHRWQEEVELVAEEMRRVERFFYWERDEWKKAAFQRQNNFVSAGTDPANTVAIADRIALDEGLVACAYRQADLRERMCEHFKYLWRFVEDWRRDPLSIPTYRSWYADCIQPDKSPHLYQ